MNSCAISSRCTSSPTQRSFSAGDYRDAQNDLTHRQAFERHYRKDQRCRQRFFAGWHGELLGHANALARLGVIDDEELREMLELADSALEHVKAQLETR